MMTDIEYDPELPFALVQAVGTLVISRHRYESDAVRALEMNSEFRRIVDTTPKPKIPEDAEFIIWDDPSDNGEERIARRYGHPANKVWRIGWDTIEESELMSYIGDAKVTVLVRKDET